MALNVTEQINLAEYEGYHGRITGAEAQRRLRRCREPCYLVRYSTLQKSYVLSVYKHQRPFDPVIMHFKIETNNGRVNITGARDACFENIQRLLEHYRLNTIDPDFANIGRHYTVNDYRQSRRICAIL